MIPYHVRCPADAQGVFDPTYECVRAPTSELRIELVLNHTASETRRSPANVIHGSDLVGPDDLPIVDEEHYESSSTNQLLDLGNRRAVFALRETVGTRRADSMCLIGDEDIDLVVFG